MAYATVSYADSYLSVHGEWQDLAGEDKQRLLELAAVLIDGEIVWSTDDGEYPKDPDDDAQPLPALKQANCEVALSGAGINGVPDYSVLFQSATGQVVTSERSKLGQLESETEYRDSRPPRSVLSRWPIVKALLRGYIDVTASGSGAKILERV